MPDAWAWLCVLLAPGVVLLAGALAVRQWTRWPCGSAWPDGTPGDLLEPFDPAELGGGEVVPVRFSAEGQWRRVGQ